MIYTNRYNYFTDREDAGRQLAFALRNMQHEDCVVMALPRGGIIPAAIVASLLKCPLGIVLVKKIGHPSYPEFAIGALISDGTKIYNHSVLATIPSDWIAKTEKQANELLSQRKAMYYQDVAQIPPVTGKSVLLVDDGIATGLTMQAAIKSLRKDHPKKIIVATPVASRDSINKLQTIADQIVVIEKPENFLGAVGAHYLQFDQVSDEVVQRKLKEASDALYKKTSSYAPFA